MQIKIMGGGGKKEWANRKREEGRRMTGGRNGRTG
jgi:hypothetical protein